MNTTQTDHKIEFMACHKIKDYFVESASGSRYKKYWIEKD